MKLQYKAWYNGKQYEFESTSLWDAKQEAIRYWKIPKSKQGLLAVMLVGKDDQPIIHSHD